ncbi:MAG: PTS mannose/fructose/sorbose transporter subunit IIC [Propionibacteriaceae bacterium]|nr:PTS mannose/fructose/sorbose transporter subunit IIC [Micropruina sp.]HBX80161.1 PTS mannose/fructose/sorbose transporter subunit IIC [Propionibacteriaceae bacterium]HBY21890.1 PTS mannose/fructose/sorbose transporter subunit IIC [Propionibacteriaceae bacterium]
MQINAVQLILVVLVAFIAGLASVLDERQFHRPLVACTLVGLVLGDMTTGIEVGGALELLALGWMNVGAAMAPDAALASTISTVIVIAGKQSPQEAIAVAVPLAVAGQALTIIVRTIAVFFQHQADNFAKHANFRGIEAMHLSALALQGLRVAIPTGIVAALASGNLVKDALSAIPTVVTDGLHIAGGFIVVVGYAMVINMMKARILMPFFFLGFIISTFMTTLGTGITLVALGIVGTCLAVVYVQLNPEFQAKPPQPAMAGAPAGSSGDLDDELD